MSKKYQVCEYCKTLVNSKGIGSHYKMHIRNCDPKQLVPRSDMGSTPSNNGIYEDGKAYDTMYIEPESQGLLTQFYATKPREWLQIILFIFGFYTGGDMLYCGAKERYGESVSTGFSSIFPLNKSGGEVQPSND
jgi:hypothetical protein